jgi:hypothetical protein
LVPMHNKWQAFSKAHVCKPLYSKIKIVKSRSISWHDTERLTSFLWVDTSHIYPDTVNSVSSSSLMSFYPSK